MEHPAVAFCLGMGASRIALAPQAGAVALRDQIGDASQFTCASARGPLSALWLTLKRVRRGMASPTAVVDDLGVAHALLGVPPSKLKRHMFASLEMAKSQDSGSPAWSSAAGRR
eukprot:565163-Pyramimonas_sp.AAC.1